MHSGSGTEHVGRAYLDASWLACCSITFAQCTGVHSEQTVVPRRFVAAATHQRITLHVLRLNNAFKNTTGYPQTCLKVQLIIILLSSRSFVSDAHCFLNDPPKSAQLEAPLPCPQVTSGYVQWCGNAAGTDRHTHRHKQTRVTNIHFASSTTHAKCKYAKSTCLNVEIQ